MSIWIRRFERADIPKKVEWVNNPENNQFLHYDIPICVEKTEKWFDSHDGQNDRYDAVIEVDDVPVGMIGLLFIDRKNSKAEFYVAMGDIRYKGKGIAKEACRLILQYGFEELELNRIYSYTEIGNTAAQKLCERMGFVREGLVRQDIANRERYVDRILYGMLRTDYTQTWGL